MSRRWVLAGVMVAGAVAGAMAAGKPRVPAGVDPGGVAIAIVGPGVDYMDARVAKRLARDGEGEIAGFDLIDGDRRPFAEKDGPSQMFVAELMEPKVPSRLALFRAKPADRVSMAQAVSFVSKGPARIVFFSNGFPDTPVPDFQFLAAASKQFPDLLFVVPAGDQAVCFNADGTDNLPNVVVVTARSPASDGLSIGGGSVDVAADGDVKLGSCEGDGTGCERHEGSYSQIAAARVAGLAARVAAEGAALGGAALKDAIVALAKANAAVVAAGATRYGVIEKTGADFRAK